MVVTSSPSLEFSRICSFYPSRALLHAHCSSSNTQQHTTHPVLNHEICRPFTSGYQYCSHRLCYLPPNRAHFGSLNPLLPKISDLSFFSVCTTMDLSTTNRVVVAPSHIHREWHSHCRPALPRALLGHCWSHNSRSSRVGWLFIEEASRSVSKVCGHRRGSTSHRNTQDNDNNPKRIHDGHSLSSDLGSWHLTLSTARLARYRTSQLKEDAYN